MLGAVVRRMVIDVPNVIAGTLPEATYDVRFVRHHWIAYLHIGPGALYLLVPACSWPIRFRAGITPSTGGSAECWSAPPCCPASSPS